MAKRVIVDNNVLISALLGKQMPFIKHLLNSTDITVYVCNELLQEFRDVSKRPKIKKYVSEVEATNLLNLIDLYCEFVIIETIAQSDVRDAKDLYLLSLAETVNADYIITGDKDLLELEKHVSTSIVSISEFSQFASFR